MMADETLGFGVDPERVTFQALSDLESCRLQSGDMSTMEMQLSIIPLSREELLCEEATLDVVVTLSINRR